jgi:hypothetical protein
MQERVLNLKEDWEESLFKIKMLEHRATSAYQKLAPLIKYLEISGGRQVTDKYESVTDIYRRIKELNLDLLTNSEDDV